MTDSSNFELERAVAAEIRAQLDALPRAGATIDPSAIARALDPEWPRHLMATVREVARQMAERGELVVTRHGKPVTEWPWRGVIRLRAVMPGGVKPGASAADANPEEAPPTAPGA